MTPHWTDVRGELERWLISHPRILLGCDYDGTLAPIVDHADDARMIPEARTALEKLNQTPGVTLAVISGRTLADLRPRINMPGIFYAGNHGLEMQDPQGLQSLAPGAHKGQPQLHSAIKQLDAILPRVPGVWVEDKHWTASIHYRLASEEHHALVGQIVKATLEGVEELVLYHGRRVWEIRPAARWNKGTALALFMKQCQVPGSATAFLGDDVTDHDAFHVISDGWPGWIGENVPAAARMKLLDPADTADLLLWMADVRLSAF